MAIFNGTAGDDVLPPVGSDNSGSDQFHGLAGNDVISAGTGADLVDGGAGIDTISYADAVWGIGINLMTGRSADGDTLVSIENVIGSRHGEQITGNDGDNRLVGGAGFDTLIGNGGDDVLVGQGGNDDKFIGGDGFDVLDFSNDYSASVSIGSIYVSTDIESVIGSLTGQDFLSGWNGNDKLYGQGGDDYLEGKAGADVLDGGTGSDTARYWNELGGMGINLEKGISHNGDILISIENTYGSRFGDIITGSISTSYINADGGNDIITIQGNTNVDGELGADTFRYIGSLDPSLQKNFGHILYFKHAEHDKIDVSRLDAVTDISGDQEFHFIGNSNFSNTPGELRYFSSNSVSMTVVGDVNGDGIADFSLILERGGLTLTSGDFVL